MSSNLLIYALVDPRSGEVRYIGQTSRGLVRPIEQLYPCQFRREKNRHKANWLRQLRDLGLTALVEVLAVCESVSSLDESEIRLIKEFRLSGHALTNLLPGGAGTRGWKHTEETKAKMRGPRKARGPLPREQVEKSAAARRGKKLSQEARSNMSQARRGRHFAPLTTDHRQKMAVSHGAKPFLDQSGRRYTSVREAARILGVDPSAISKVLQGKNAHVGGYILRFIE